MAMEKTPPAFEPNLVIEQGTLRNYTLHKGKKNADGEIVEDPAIELRIRVPVDRVERYLGVLTKVWKLEKGLTLGLAFIEQLEHRMADAVAANGHAPATSGLTPIEGGKKGPSRKKRDTVTT
jgi:hypothetical protein